MISFSKFSKPGKMESKNIFEVIKTAAEAVNIAEVKGGTGDEKLLTAVNDALIMLKENSGIPEAFLKPEVITDVINIVVMLVNIIIKRDWFQVFKLGELIFQLIKKI